MSKTVKVEFDPVAVLKGRGLGPSNGVQKHLASEVKRFCDPYVPMQQGMLKNLSVIAADGSQITYIVPYAHYQYYGKVMVGRAPKKYTGADLDYHGGPTRGPQWDKRMMADKSGDIVKSVENYIAKRGG